MEKRQSDFKQKKRFVSSEAHSQLLLIKLANYEKNLTEVRTSRIGKEAKLAVIKEELGKGQYFNIPSTDASDSPSREKHIAKLKVRFWIWKSNEKSYCKNLSLSLKRSLSSTISYP